MHDRVWTTSVYNQLHSAWLLFHSLLGKISN